MRLSAPLWMAWACAHAGAAELPAHGRFQQVQALHPIGPVQRVVLWFEGGDDAVGVRRDQEALAADGALVARVPVEAIADVLRSEQAGACAFSAGDVENYSRFMQAWLKLPGYHLPILAGDGRGAALAYAASAQATAGSIAGTLDTGLCADARVPVAICGDGVHEGRVQATTLPRPWLSAQPRRCAASRLPWEVALARPLRRSAQGDAGPALVAAARVLGAQAGVSLAPPPDDLRGLPVVEVPASRQGDTLAIFLSGDGGWAGLDKNVAAAMADAGVAVVGLDSLRYFWSARTPEGLARDLESIAAHYSRAWQRPRLMLIGFSQGADVLPAAIDHLDAGTRRQLRMTALLSAGRSADFEFHVSNWLGGSDTGRPIAPDVLRLPSATTLCLYGVEDADALCPGLPAGSVQVVALPGDHHFHGDDARLAREILQRLPR